MAVFSVVPLGGNDGLRRHAERVPANAYAETIPGRFLWNWIEAARG